MTRRFCIRCGTEVEDADGYCLLGHPLRLHAPTDSLKALRAEVDIAFEHARAQVAEAITPASIAATPVGDSVSAVPAGQAPPPPPPPRPATTDKGVWAGLEQDTAAPPDDPIAAFAPAPRMDWGPDRTGLGLLKRRS